MVVWQGITEGGTAVPVQITEEGKVVAIGETGPTGPTGPIGPPGPPGETFPPDPFEGAFLVWLDGKPTWYAESPVPIPPGLSSVITGVDSEALLIFEKDVDQDVFFKGATVYAADENGSPWPTNSSGQNTSQFWERYLTGTAPESFISNPINAFDGNMNTFAINTGGDDIIFIPPKPIQFNSKVEFYTESGSPGDQKQEVSINDGPFVKYSGADNVLKTVATGPGVLSKFWYKAPFVGSARLNVLKVDGEFLIGGGAATGTINTSPNSNTVLLGRWTGSWKSGMYMRSDATAIASWLLVSRKSEKAD